MLASDASIPPGLLTLITDTWTQNPLERPTAADVLQRLLALVSALPPPPQQQQQQPVPAVPATVGASSAPAEVAAAAAAQHPTSPPPPPSSLSYRAAVLSDEGGSSGSSSTRDRGGVSVPSAAAPPCRSPPTVVLQPPKKKTLPSNANAPRGGNVPGGSIAVPAAAAPKSTTLRLEEEVAALAAGIAQQSLAAPTRPALFPQPVSSPDSASPSPTALLPSLLRTIGGNSSPASASIPASTSPVIPSQSVRTSNLQGHTSNVTSIVSMPGGLFATGSLDGAVRVWNRDSTTTSKKFLLFSKETRVTALSCLLDGLLAVGSDTPDVLLLTIASGKCRPLPSLGPGSVVSCLAVLPIGFLAVSVSSSDGINSIRLWSFSVGRYLVQMHGDAPALCMAAISDAAISDAAISDSKLVAGVGGKIAMWEVSAGNT